MTADSTSSECVNRYEALRAGVFGEPVPPELRGGLAVLRSRGVCAWIRALSAVPQSPRSHAASVIAPRGEHSDLVHLIADLASARSGRNL